MLSVDIRHATGDFALEVAFTAPPTGVTALFGPSGAGKSTVLNAVAGLLRPQGGRIALGGETLFDAATRALVPAHRRRIGVVFQEGRLFPHLSVRDNLLFGRRRSPDARSGPAIGPVVDLLGLGGLLGRSPVTLSGGERQRVALGRALLMRPRWLLLDEPLSALDMARRAEILPYLERLRDQSHVPMLLVSHAIDEVARLADRVVLLDAGRVEADGTVAEVFSRLDLAHLTGQFEAGAVLHAVVAGHDPAYGLTRLTVDGGTVTLPGLDLPVGSAVRLRVRSRDVMLATVEPQGVSANTILSVTVAAVKTDGAVAYVRLALGGQHLVSRITRLSADRLALAPGQPVYAVIKAVTVDR